MLSSSSKGCELLQFWIIRIDLPDGFSHTSVEIHVFRQNELASGIGNTMFNLAGQLVQLGCGSQLSRHLCIRFDQVFRGPLGIQIQVVVRDTSLGENPCVPGLSGPGGSVVESVGDEIQTVNREKFSG